MSSNAYFDYAISAASTSSPLRGGSPGVLALPFHRMTSAAEIHLHGSIVKGWEFQQPLAISVQQDSDGSYIASDESFACYGHGPTWDDAVRDFAISLTEYYQLVEEGTDAGSHKELRRLQAYLQKKR